MSTQHLLATAALGFAVVVTQSVSTAHEPDAPVLRSLAETLRAPIVDDVSHPGTVWARTRTMRARFDETGLTVYPVFGRKSPSERPIATDVVSATVGASDLECATVAAPLVQGESVVQHRGAFREVHHVGLDGIEQTFEFDSLPEVGDLTLVLGVETDLAVEETADAIRFDAPGLGHVTYGEAVLVDALGARTPIERTWTGAGIEFRVDADVVAAAALPFVIDPLWETFNNVQGIDDDAHPDIAYCELSQEYTAVWEDYTSAVNADVFLTSWAADFSSQSQAWAVDLSNEDWREPALAYCAGNDRVLVAASVDNGTGNSTVKARLFHVSTTTWVAPPFAITSPGFNKNDVDVAGTSYVAAGGVRYAVTWSDESVIGIHTVGFRILDSDGGFVTPVESIAPGAGNDVQPSISAGAGDILIPGHSWHVVWVRDDDFDGEGEVWAQRISTSGIGAFHSAPFEIDGFDVNANPSVTSQLDQLLPLTGSRPAVVAYERNYADAMHPTGRQADIVACVISDDTRHERSFVTQMEGFDRHLDQSQPVIATNGEALFIAYLEEPWTGPPSDRWNVHMATAELSITPQGARLALMERHLPLATTTRSEYDPAIATRWVAQPGSTAIDGACIWMGRVDTAPNGYGDLWGQRFEYTFGMHSLVGSVGSQYCSAVPNSVGSFGGRNAGWLTIVGNQDRGILHTATAQDLPLNAFGYLLASRSLGFSASVPNSVGALCLGGAIGRYVDQIDTSGMTGQLSFVVDPLAMPQPTGPESAMVGETWMFQVWHRDSHMGMPSSNFTNACSVMFVQ